ncbi:protease modulator HflC [Buchnera aphidicola]|uniref:Protein HflC n=1 Tax=Buchnera aphidicola str. USDA (Myzus persicae) TaxID=1009856 RepID=W0NZE9_BUCMP|nr:protease modulator HflC [Buchnera aphidicola]AHG59839.1 Hflc [Buchnera aphidicola str. USDA (Myzus persicae)]AHG60419.1 Hflc [Buchnera aphidicola str. W106 (Myzus persicae)]AHG60992.1 Hflc [Buchnera aphidicola str. G002 (Myzus persicae)]AHG61564.1 Hflc [Buchnera aphidicola str. F009 (Myzus persicae)]WAI03404.1 MAG: protease modulator HflC [Buchnera aphidicola (Myzus persicae)]
MRKVLICLSSILFFLFSSSFFIVKEGERGIVLQFGRVLRNNEQKTLVYTPGLHFKFPFLETVKMLDARIHTMDNQADRFVTKEKKDLIVDSYIKWRINDFSRYYLATGGGDIFQAEVLLKRKFSDRLRSEIGCLNVKEIVTDSRGRLTTDVLNSLNRGTINLENTSLINVNSMNALGIQVVDVRIKQINLPVEVSDAIYNRMRAEREAVARSQRSQGQEKAEKLRATADYKVSIILSEAKKEALIIKGKGEAKVTKIFAENFSKEPYFYYFIRSLRAYENSFKKNENLMLLSSDSEFFKYINKMIAIEK